jgi:hypothetical protein
LHRGVRRPDALLDRGPLFADGGRLLKGGSTLLGGQLWHRHGIHLDDLLCALAPSEKA